MRKPGEVLIVRKIESPSGAGWDCRAQGWREKIRAVYCTNTGVASTHPVGTTPPKASKLKFPSPLYVNW
jgi:hypothetical protein